jgi:hypothetical protein
MTVECAHSLVKRAKLVKRAADYLAFTNPDIDSMPEDMKKELPETPSEQCLSPSINDLYQFVFAWRLNRPSIYIKATNQEFARAYYPSSTFPLSSMSLCTIPFEYINLRRNVFLDLGLIGNRYAS